MKLERFAELREEAGVQVIYGIKGRELSTDGSYHRPKSRRKRRRSQELLYEEARGLIKQAEQSQRTVFEPHRAPDIE